MSQLDGRRMELVFAIQRGVITRCSNFRNSPDLKKKKTSKQTNKQRQQQHVKTSCDKHLHTMHSSVLWTVILLSQRNESSFKNELELKTLLASKDLRTLVSSNTLFFYCSYLTGIFCSSCLVLNRSGFCKYGKTCILFTQ